jgi:hypothetical protein
MRHLQACGPLTMCCRVTTGMSSLPSAPNFAEPEILPALRLPSLERLTLEDLQLETAAEAVSNQHLHQEVRDLLRFPCFLLAHESLKGGALTI